ncbi:hypothetical protein [Pseudanabaena sp. BC1403]|uniref:hypothetical protein n=1 Tax=Pseudanabaena sp. BC1403 TaxID=2043171 RepID=UPI000CD9BF79|nr:hypothetical protein [Pseudanabaena sp. BC1403]
MSELTEIAAIILKHLSDAMLSAASELSKGKNSNPIIESSKPETAILNVGSHVIFELKNGKRYGAIVNKLDGDRLEVENKELGKIWTISTSEIVQISKGDFYY